MVDKTAGTAVKESVMCSHERIGRGVALCKLSTRVGRKDSGRENGILVMTPLRGGEGLLIPLREAIGEN